METNITYQNCFSSLEGGVNTFSHSHSVLRQSQPNEVHILFKQAHALTERVTCHKRVFYAHAFRRSEENAIGLYAALT